MKRIRTLKIFWGTLLIGLIAGGCGGEKKENRPICYDLMRVATPEEKAQAKRDSAHIADSLNRVDSILKADSVRLADSLKKSKRKKQKPQRTLIKSCYDPVI